MTTKNIQRVIGSLLGLTILAMPISTFAASHANSLHTSSVSVHQINNVSSTPTETLKNKISMQAQEKTMLNGLFRQEKAIDNQYKHYLAIPNRNQASVSFAHQVTTEYHQYHQLVTIVKSTSVSSIGNLLQAEREGSLLLLNINRMIGSLVTISEQPSSTKVVSVTTSTHHASLKTVYQEQLTFMRKTLSNQTLVVTNLYKRYQSMLHNTKVTSSTSSQVASSYDQYLRLLHEIQSIKKPSISLIANAQSNGNKIMAEIIREMNHLGSLTQSPLPTK